MGAARRRKGKKQEDEEVNFLNWEGITRALGMRGRKEVIVGGATTYRRRRWKIREGILLSPTSKNLTLPSFA